MSSTAQQSTILVACAPGLSSFLADELRGLGYAVGADVGTGVETRGTLADTLPLNLHVRTGNRVLFQIGAFRAHDAETFYGGIRGLAWEAYLLPEGYFTVTSFARSTAVRDPRFVNVKCKDAIADRMREACGRRPDSGNARSGAVVFVYWNGGDVKVYLDTSGESLSRRGYRRIPMDAPMQETLASGVVLATGWTGGGHFINPMCGSGTLAIEAALLGLGRAPGLLRQSFGLLHLRGVDRAAWTQLRRSATARRDRPLGGRIIATDIRREAVEAARQNARSAGVERCIEFGVCDFDSTEVPPGGGVVVLNPEYGERMGSTPALEAVYGRIGDFFKKRCQGYTGYVFTGNLDLAKRIGLRTTRRLPLFNGPIECRLLEFGLYAGTRRAAKAEGRKIQPGNACQMGV